MKTVFFPGISSNVIDLQDRSIHYAFYTTNVEEIVNGKKLVEQSVSITRSIRNGVKPWCSIITLRRSK